MRRLMLVTEMEKAMFFTFLDHECAINRKYKVLNYQEINFYENFKMAASHRGCTWAGIIFRGPTSM